MQWLALQEKMKTTKHSLKKKKDKTFPHLFLFLPIVKWKGREPGYI